MRQRTELRQRQKQEFNARFSAAIQILQRPVAELADEIRDVLDTNPLLEEFDTPASDPADSFGDPPNPASSTIQADSDSWLDYTAQAVETQSVRDHLMQQLYTAGLNGNSRIIAETIVQAVDDRGYLTESIEEIRDLIAGRTRTTVADVEHVLKVVQQFGPPGIAARDLRESLLNQLDAIDATSITAANARKILRDFFDLLSHNLLQQIAADAALDAESVDQAIALIRSLNPYPGYQFGNAATPIVPDLIARKIDDHWQVQLNLQVLPKIRISSHYRNMMNSIDKGEGRDFLKQNLISANVFLQNLNRRHETIIRVGKEIVKHQQAFLEYGDQGMKPLKISDVALSLDLHESTVSRACSRKYIMTPRGTFELKRFFSVRIPNRFGNDESAEAIKHKIARLVKLEDANFPLSDQQITEQLRGSGAQISRRTVAKYRTELRIPAYGSRKRLTINQLEDEVV